MSTETPTASDPFTDLVNALKASLLPAPTPPSVSGSPMAMPVTYSGDVAECSGFLLQVELYIRMQPQRFPTESSKVAFLISLLSGKALHTAASSLTTSDQLFRLRQGSSLVQEYTIHFHTLAAASGWNSSVLTTRGSTQIYEPLWLSACQPPITASQPTSVAACLPVPEPMQIDYSRLTHTERNRRLTSGLCLYCGNNGHLIRNCPVKPPCPVVSTSLIEVEISNLSLIPVTLHSSRNSLSISALIDSGSSSNFISQECLDQLQLTQRHNHEYSVKTIQGKPLGCGKVRYCSPLITLQVGLFHKEQLQFLVLEDSTVGLILGCPWLHLHTPVLYWDPCDVLQWGKQCYEQCLSELPHPQSISIPLTSIKVESPEPEFTPEIPAEYMAFQDVFSKQAATQLPPHRPWDCAIELLPGAQLPKGRIYPLSIPERQAMEEYIKEALKQGFIQPSTSPAASSSSWARRMEVFVPVSTIANSAHRSFSRTTLEELHGARVFSKLDLQSAYNFIRIITSTGHYEYRVMPYGLSISPSVFQTFMNEVFWEFLHQFVVVYIDDILIYSRNLVDHCQQVLEKREFHQSSVQFLGYVISAEGVQMDQEMVQAIQEWPTPSTIKELKRFLGFSNFYRRFINGYSMITTQLTSLLRGKPKHLVWNPAAHEAFHRLKSIFCTAPLLRHPDPDLPFRAEVDASTSGVEAVLSQAVSDPPLFHPCAYFFRKLTMAEQNYDVGNRELLAIKLALEEWRHWLEGSVHQFTIITDHKNLQYLREAKCLNPRQACRALFLTRFNFKITYRPGTKNTKADALSRQFSANSPAEPEPIIWDLEDDIRHAIPRCY
ncbi:Transposon Tf2-8 polyprotein [Labeo rohita]|uniref:ribonuclease H n=1 Tax=Labeo rohita TaxID=84645 RepID=A0ABQ8M5F9_LABRO|nr:Transposon Tf2-8 polyprotein [Labeo rohita]